MKCVLFVATVALAFTAALSSTPAQAQPFFRTFVSGTGSDGNPCTRTQPCLTFQRAHDNTIAGGEIDVLDPGGYGPFVINRSISIVNDGVGTVGVRALSGGTAITINAGTTDVVNLRGFTIEGAGVGFDGIRFNTGKALTIQNSVVRNFMNDGIRFIPNQSAASSLTVKDTLVANNGNDGIFIGPLASGAVTAVLNRVDTDSNFHGGINLTTSTGLGAVTATAADCEASGNSDAFLTFTNSASPMAGLMLVGSVAANNDSGIVAIGAGSIIRVGLTTITGNANGWVATGGVVQSYGDNKINGNASNETSPPAVTGGGK